jgi:hypothetical protein
MTDTLLQTAFWTVLDRLRTTSQLVLIALERDDVETVERLSREADDMIATIRPELDARAAADEEGDFRPLVFELQRLNGRVLERLEEKKRETLERLGQIRTHRLQLVHFRHAGDSGNELDREG